MSSKPTLESTYKEGSRAITSVSPHGTIASSKDAMVSTAGLGFIPFNGGPVPSPLAMRAMLSKCSLLGAGTVGVDGEAILHAVCWPVGATPVLVVGACSGLSAGVNERTGSSMAAQVPCEVLIDGLRAFAPPVGATPVPAVAACPRPFTSRHK